MLADPASQIRISEWWDDDQAIQSMLSGLRILENSSKIPIPFRIESDSTNRGRKESRQQLFQLDEKNTKENVRFFAYYEIGATYCSH